MSKTNIFRMTNRIATLDVNHEVSYKLLKTNKVYKILGKELLKYLVPYRKYKIDTTFVDLGDGEFELAIFVKEI